VSAVDDIGIQEEALVVPQAKVNEMGYVKLMATRYLNYTNPNLYL